MGEDGGVSIVGKSQVSGAKIATDSYTGRSRGLAFVEMENAADADRARAALGGKQCGGRTLK
jgi:RNA recognition motif-containing protein